MTDRKTNRFLAAAAVAGAAVFGAGATASAQDAAAQQQQMQQAAPVTDKEVKQFVKAEKEINSIVEEWAPKVQSAGNQQEAEELQGEAQTQMVAAIEKEGLSVNRYNEIYQQAQLDPQLAERIRENA